MTFPGASATVPRRRDGRPFLDRDDDVPTVLPQDGDAVFVRVAVHDDGQDGTLCLVGEVHATVAR